MNKFITKAIRSAIHSLDGQLDSLATDETTMEYIADLLSDLEITKDEKLETIQGIFDLHLDLSSAPPPSSSNLAPGSAGLSSQNDLTSPKTTEELVKDLIEQADLYLSTREEDDAQSDSSGSERKSSPSRASSSSSTRKREIEEEERMKELERKKAIINNYGKIEEDMPSQKSQGLDRPLADDVEDEVSKDLLNEELKLLDMKKRQRKKVESKKYTNTDELLLRPNLNAKIVEHEEKLKKQELSSKARAKMEKDKADLNKQKENQLKKKMDARAKAKKLERRA